ncbi:MAG: hypothetical protein JXQ71_15760 [Verrucomicrobia bacterium]|nr:hypothetical protein [Verrucomicrobiota bacterium]
MNTMRRSIAAALAALAFPWLGLSDAGEVACAYHAGTQDNPAAAPDPATPEGGGWTLNDVTAGDADFTWGGVSPDGATGLNAWRVLDNSTASGRFLYYSHALSAPQQSDAGAYGWKLAAVFRLQDPVADNAGARAAYLFFGDNANTRFIAFFDILPSGALEVNFQGTGGGTVVLTTDAAEAAGYNTHEVWYDPATRRAEYRFNGAVRWSAWAGSTGAYNGVKWGTESSGGRGDGYWNSVTFTINDPPPLPGVALHPQSSTNAVGDRVTFTGAFTNLVLSHQWYKDGAPIPGATQAAFTLPFVTVLDAGSYLLRASNTVGTADTDPATLTVLPDTTPPAVVRAVASVFASRLRLHFSEPVLAASAVDRFNYAFPDAAFELVDLAMADRFTVDLALAPAPVPGSNYVVLVSFVQDDATNAMPENVCVPFSAPSGFPAMGQLVAAFNGSVTAADPADGVTWPDQSGNENHALSYSTATNRRPTLIESNLNGFATLNFHRPSQQALTIAGPTSTGFHGSNLTWFIVAKPTNVAGFNPNLLRHSSTFSAAAWGSFMFGGNASTGYQPAFVSNGRRPAGSAIEAVAFPIQPGHWMICEGYVNGDLGESYSRVETPASNTVVSATNSAATPTGYGEPLLTWIGRSPTVASDAFDGEMAEVLVYSGVLDAVQRAEVQTHLRTKYFSQPPTVAITATATNLQIAFTGVLQAAPAVDGAFEDVEGVVTSPLEIPLESATNTLFFRARRP